MIAEVLFLHPTSFIPHPSALLLHPAVSDAIEWALEPNFETSMSVKPQICAVITETTCDAARKALNASASVADLAELRLDYLEDFDFTDTNSLARILEANRLPVIITCRSIAEGGR